MMPPCCACRDEDTVGILDLGKVPAADTFPVASSTDDSRSDLGMMLCRHCGLLQLIDDDTEPEVPRGVEPQALVEQAERAVHVAVEAGWISGTTAREFPSPHGGSWLPILRRRGYQVTQRPADVVLDSFGIMHEADQAAAWKARAKATTRRGTLLVQVHAASAILEKLQWTSVRHGHAAYYSVTALQKLLASVGMSMVDARVFPLYGDGADGTVLVAARHGRHKPSSMVNALLAHDAAVGVTDPERLKALQDAVDRDLKALRVWLEQQREVGRRVHAYGAASRAVALFAMAGLDTSLVASVADAARAKHGRRMPGTNIPIVSPQSLITAEPDVVLVTLPDLIPELTRTWPQLAGRLVTESSLEKWSTSGGKS